MDISDISSGNLFLNREFKLYCHIFIAELNEVMVGCMISAAILYSFHTSTECLIVESVLQQRDITATVSKMQFKSSCKLKNCTQKRV